MDEMSRSITFLDQVGKGVDPAEAVSESLRTIGDFNRLTPRERSLVRRVFPFYTWLKHVTQLTARLPFEHPGRIAGIHAIGQLYGPEPGTEEFEQFGNFPFFGNLTGGVPGLAEGEVLRTQFLNPFGSTFDPLSGIQGSAGPLDAARRVALGGSSPFIRAGAGLFGTTVSPSGSIFTTPNRGIGDRLGVLREAAINLTPQGRTVANLLRDDVQRDALGQPRTEPFTAFGFRGERQVQNPNRLPRGISDLIGLAGIPRPLAVR